MGQIISIFLGIINAIFFGPWWAKLFAAGIVGTIAVLVYKDSIKPKKQMRTQPFVGIGLNGENKVLHIIPSGCPTPKNISQHLRGFQNAGELYHYAYQEFEEALFDKIVVHSASGPPTTFTRDDSQSDEQNLVLLHAQLASA